MQTIAALQQKLGHCESIRIHGPAADYPVFDITRAQCKARIALHGAHVLQFQPTGTADLLWLSSLARYQAGIPVRGGIPLCWPWFGPHPQHPHLPAHGFVRNRFWQLDSVQEGENATQLLFTLRDDADSLAVWPHRFELRYTVTLGASLQADLEIRNTDSQPWSYGGALHTYLGCEDIEHTRISGLDGIEYIDKVAASSLQQQHGDIQIGQEVDRVYLNTATAVLITDAAMPRWLRVEKTGSRTTVVWNPWSDKAVAMADFDNEGYRKMLCVEAANTAADEILLQPGDSHVLGTAIHLGTQ